MEIVEIPRVLELPLQFPMLSEPFELFHPIRVFHLVITLF